MLHWLFFALIFTIASMTYAQNDPEQKLKEMNIELPAPNKPMANYVKYVRTGNLVFLAGEGPRRADGSLITGKLGKDLTVEQGYEAAKLTAINMISTLKDAVGGDLKKVKRIVKVFGLVNCTDDFKDQPKVMNGFSDLLVAVFGENGKHARAAVGTNALPSGIAVEVEFVAEVE